MNAQPDEDGFDEERLQYQWNEGYDSFLDGVEYEEDGDTVVTFIEDRESLLYFREMSRVGGKTQLAIYEKGSGDTKIKSDLIVDLENAV